MMLLLLTRKTSEKMLGSKCICMQVWGLRAAQSWLCSQGRDLWHDIMETVWSKHVLWLWLSVDYSLDIVLLGREQAKDLTSESRRPGRAFGSCDSEEETLSGFRIWDFTSTGEHKHPRSLKRLLLSGNKDGFIADSVSEGMILADFIDLLLRFIHTVTFPRSLGPHYLPAALFRSRAGARTKHVN